MKIGYSIPILLFIGIGISGITLAFAIQNPPRMKPIQLKAPVLGRQADGPATPIEDFTILEIQQLIDREYRDHWSSHPGTVEELKIEAVSMSIAPPRHVPLIGDASLVKAKFWCSAKMTHPDGTTNIQDLVAQKNSFRLIKRDTSLEQTDVE
jgi:hypothetical protein